jgi:XTP/dITP diphosphohydrolase
MLEIVLGTGNRHKRREIEAILAGAPVVCLGPDAVGPLPEIDEDRPTLEGNAAKKACETAAAVGRPVVSDDSGLEVEALDGRPGVHSARYAGPECSARRNNAKLLAALAGVPTERRGALFRCVISMADPDGLLFTVEGRCPGRILETQRGTEGFGYDPVFYYPPAAMSFAPPSPPSSAPASPTAACGN